MKIKQTIKSMTGYGRSEVQMDEKNLVTEIRSVNHRFLEISVKLPLGWLSFEEKIRKLVRERLSRGRVDLLISLDGTISQERQLQFDWKLFHDYLQVRERLANEYGISEALHFRDLFHRDDLWTFTETVENHEQLSSAVFQSVQEACEQLVVMRHQEGKRLADDLIKRCQTLREMLEELKERAPQVSKDYRKRLEERLEDWIDLETFDQERLLTEVALFADKADITEECIRLLSHIEQFEQSLFNVTEPVGRRLDFLIQEMNREINTIGSKANDQIISYWVVQSKSELEKMKEQVQNIE